MGSWIFDGGYGACACDGCFEVGCLRVQRIVSVLLGGGCWV